MCEPSVLKGAKTKNGYDFNPMFSKVAPLLSEADYAIANFESPLAGEEASYTHSYYVFNAPDEYAAAVKNAGMDLVSTANNHTFDRGMAGLIRTLETLDKYGVAHTGTYAPHAKRRGAHYFEIDGTRFAVVAYTYSTNWDDGENDPRDVICEGEYEGTVNLLLNQKSSVYLPGVWRGDDKIDKFFKKWIPDEERRGRIKALLGKESNYARADDNLKENEMTPYIEALTRDIEEDKKIVKTTFSILKAVEKKGKLLVSYPVDVLYSSLKSKKSKRELENEVKAIYKTVKGYYPESNIIKKEYDL